MKKEILYYTDNRLDKNLMGVVQDNILKSGLPIISVSLKPLEFGKNIHYQDKRSHSTLYRQILTGLKASNADVMFFCEHDVLYHPSHFEFVPEYKDVYYYNNNVVKYRLEDRKIVQYDCKWLSQMCAYRSHLIRHYEKRLKMIDGGEKAWGFEPGTGQSRLIDKYDAESFESEFPNIDIRHGKNATGVSRMDPSEFKNKKNCQNFKVLDINNIPGWDSRFLLSL